METPSIFMKDLIANLLKLQMLEFKETAPADREKQIADLRAKIPAQILAHYDRLVVRGKKGVAAVRNQVCTGCHVQVPRAVVLTLMHGDDIQICESCWPVSLPGGSGGNQEDKKNTGRQRQTRGGIKRGLNPNLKKRNGAEKYPRRSCFQISTRSRQFCRRPSR